MPSPSSCGERARATVRLAGHVVDDLFEGVLDRRLVLDGLLVDDLGLAHQEVYAELLLDPPGDHVEMQLAHAADHGLIGVLVVFTRNVGSSFADPLEHLDELFLVGVPPRLDGHGDDGLVHPDGFEDDGLRPHQGMARRRLLEAHDPDDVARRSPP